MLETYTVNPLLSPLPLITSPPPFQGKKVNKLPPLSLIYDRLYKSIKTVKLHVD